MFLAGLLMQLRGAVPRKTEDAIPSVFLLLSVAFLIFFSEAPRPEGGELIGWCFAGYIRYYLITVIFCLAFDLSPFESIAVTVIVFFPALA